MADWKRQGSRTHETRFHVTRNEKERLHYTNVTNWVFEDQETRKHSPSIKTAKSV